MSQKQKGFLQGALILGIGTIIVKILGAIYKIPINSILGETGAGYSQSAYGLYYPLYTVSVVGVPVAISKLVSQYMAKNRYHDVKRVFKVSAVVFSLIGLIGSLILFFGAGLFARIADNLECFYSLRALAPSVFFCSVMSIYRGYYNGMNNMVPTMVSQVLEALCKLIFGLLLAILAIKVGLDSFWSTGLVYGEPAESEQAARTLTMPYAAAGAILGVTLGSVVGTIYVFLRHKIKGDGITREMVKRSPDPISNKAILKALACIAVPVVIAALGNNVSSLIDSVSTIRVLRHVASNNGDMLMQKYGFMLTTGQTIDNLPNSLSGAYNGFALTLFNLIPTITAVFGISVLPVISKQWELKNRDGVRQSVESVLRITSMIGIPAGLGMMVLSKSILKLLFPTNISAVEVAAPLLSIMGIGVVCVSLVTPINSILQAIGKAKITVLLLFYAAIIKLATNIFLISIPSINIKGAAYATSISYIFLVVASLIAIKRYIKTKISLKDIFAKSFIAGTMCSIGAYAANGLLQKVLPSSASVLIAIAIGGVVYIISLILVKGLVQNDVSMLPNGEKIVKTLEKLHWIE